MVRGIKIDIEDGESSCSTCGYIFDHFEDAQRHFEEECDPHDEEIEPHHFQLDVTVSSPALNWDKARQNIEQWEKEVQESIGGISFQIESINREDWPE